MTSGVGGVSDMVRVTATDDPEAQLVLIVDNNPMGTMRISQVFTQKGWRIEVCEDGDLAVDTYVQHRPDLVLLALEERIRVRDRGGRGRRRRLLRRQVGREVRRRLIWWLIGR